MIRHFAKNVDLSLRADEIGVAKNSQSHATFKAQNSKPKKKKHPRLDKKSSLAMLHNLKFKAQKSKPRKAHALKRKSQAQTSPIVVKPCVVVLVNALEVEFEMLC